ACCLLAAEPPKGDPKAPPLPDLTEYRSPATALGPQGVLPAGRAGQTGYLGVSVVRDAVGRLLVEGVQPDSPAARAGLKRGAAIRRGGDQPVKTPQAFREWLQMHGPGQAVKLGLLREEKPLEVLATLGAASRPMSVSRQRLDLGLELGEAKEGEGVR